ncbi:hypothetical protein FOYG_05507 [Fusarium oxysporum NRRL 32931]|uniref:Uncharacterized protein n=1 Tax=Fusarium oxysporum NRRL 32931 TaxID=660029 RepID=W9IWX2_FUSOX|nr:hypothetical protein FOYG_05507 [Fusarium oxysporum NRRL 32931]
MKFDGWVSLPLDNRICVDNSREPWTITSVGELLTECRKRAMMDGKGHIQEDLKQKAKEANLEAVPKSPSGLIEQLAQVVNGEIPCISFKFFTMHNIAWSLLTDLKRALTAGVGPEFLTYVHSEDQLPFVVATSPRRPRGTGASMSESAAWEMIGSSTSPQKPWTSFHTRVKETLLRRRGMRRLGRRTLRMLMLMGRSCGGRGSSRWSR